MAETPRKVDCKTCGTSTPVYQLSKEAVCVHCVVFRGSGRLSVEPKKSRK